MKTNNGCTICGDSILADTEDWESPLCNYHYERQAMKTKIDFSNLFKEFNDNKVVYQWLILAQRNPEIPEDEIIFNIINDLCKVNKNLENHIIDHESICTTVLGNNYENKD